MSEITSNKPMAPSQELDWALDEALRDVPEAVHAVLFSADGLVLARSSGLDRETAERTAAGLSGLSSMARGTAEFCGDPASPWRQTVSEYAGGYILLVKAGAGAYVAVSATQRVDMEALANRVQVLVARLGAVMTSPQRHDTGIRPT